MPAVDTAAALKPVVNGLPANFMTDGPTYAKGATLGFEGMSFYVGGRGAVLGDVDADVVTAAFVYFEPESVRSGWELAGTVMSREQAAAEFAECCDQWGRDHLSDGPDYERAAELIGKVVNDASPAGAPLFAAWRALDEPDDEKALVIHRLNGLRELRGALHASAIIAAGFEPLEAVMVTTPYMAGIFGWPEPHPVVDAADARMATAEAATDAAFARAALGTLSDAEQAELVAISAEILAAQV